MEHGVCHQALSPAMSSAATITPSKLKVVELRDELKKRGLEDWELVEKIPESEHNIPYWFIAIFVAMFLVAIGLNFPFWGDRAGYEREWFNWGLPLALVYTGTAVVVIYWLVDYRHIHRAKKEARAKALSEQSSGNLPSQPPQDH